MNTKTPATNFDRIVRLPECTKISGRSAASIHRDEKKGTFPRRVRLGDHSVGWLLSSLLRWIAEREEVTSGNCKQVAPGAKRGRKPRNSIKEG